MKKFLLCLLFLTLCHCAFAQFFIWGVDDGALKWHQIETDHYRIVYPENCDSLALEYARTLEKFHDPIGLDLGYSATQMLKKKMPVIIHTGNVNSNGMVVWAPKRMELISTPDLSKPVSTPWMEHLILHESRHVSQMQFTQDKGWKVGRVFLGDIMSGVASALITDPSMLEGDAVVAETALTNTGRGRSGEFLEYYHAAFDQDDMRNFWRWRYGSQKYYTPDYYRAGYIRVAGTRVLSENPMAVRDYIAKPYIGGKKLERMFRQVSDSLKQEWALSDSLRGPFPEMDTLSPTYRRYTETFGNTTLNGYIYSVRKGLDRNPELIRVDKDGNIERLSSFSRTSSRLQSDTLLNRIVWTETVGDGRWSFKSYSVIRYRDSEGKIRNLTGGTRYFNVSCSDSLNIYAAVCYPGDGTCSIDVIDSRSGEKLESYRCPAGMEYIDVFFYKGDILASAITVEGAGIYNVSKGNVPLLKPSYAGIFEAKADESGVHFVSDRSGVSELYTLDPENGSIRQRSLTKFGGYDWMFQGDSLVFNAVAGNGKNLSKVPSVDIPVDTLKYEFSSFLSKTVAQQEDSLGTLGLCCTEPEIGEPEKYSKVGHLFRFHSWAPLFIHYDAVESQSFSSISSLAEPGAMAFFQNDLSTSTGYAGIRLDTKDSWSPYFNLNYKYTGLYPVFELNADIGKKQSASAKIYIPWAWSRGGISTGLIPQVSGSIYSTPFTVDKEQYLNAKVTADIRAYAMTAVAPSAIYPRLGIGVQAGVSLIPSLLGKVQNNVFFYLYGYLPGVIRTHGIKLSSLTQFHAGEGKYCIPYANIAPRGLSSSEVLTAISRFPVQTKLTVDYAMPVFPVDWSWASPVAYIKNFELIPHFDWSYFTDGRNNTGTLNSVGADFDVCLGNFLWIPYTTRIGVSYSYCGGSYFETLVKNNINVRQNYFGLILSVDF